MLKVHCLVHSMQAFFFFSFLSLHVCSQSPVSYFNLLFCHLNTLNKQCRYNTVPCPMVIHVSTLIYIYRQSFRFKVLCHTTWTCALFPPKKKTLDRFSLGRPYPRVTQIIIFHDANKTIDIQFSKEIKGMYPKLFTMQFLIRHKYE